MNKERFEYLYNLLPWNVEPEDVADYNEVKRITGIAIKQRFEELYQTHRQLIDAETLKSESAGGLLKR